GLFVVGIGLLTALAIRAMCRRDLVAVAEKNAMILLAGFSVGYVIGVDAIVSLNDLPILDRYIFPAILPLTACLILRVDIALTQTTSSLARVAVLVCAALWFVLPVKNLMHLLVQEMPIRASAPAVRNSGLVAFLKGIDPDALAGEREEDANFAVLHLGRCVRTRGQPTDGNVKYVVRTTSLGGTDMATRADPQREGEVHAGQFGTVSMASGAAVR